jgi:hypothetical protein
MNRIASLETTKQDSLVRLVASICLLTSPWWVYNLFFPFSPGFGIENRPLAIIPVLVVVIPVQIGLIQWRSAGDRFMAEVMLAGSLLKLAAVSMFLLMITRVYKGDADMVIYFSHANAIVDKYSLTGEWTFLHPFWSNNFIVMLSSWLSFVFGPTCQGLMILFATLSYWGEYLFFRAYCIAFPNGRHKAAALFMFFLPSIVFWAAAIGKDAVIFFFIGACCYGFAKVMRTGGPTSFAIVLVSLGGVSLVRPHIAGMLALSLVCAYLLSQNRLGFFGMASKILGVPLLLFASVYFAVQASTFVDLKDLEQTQKVLGKVADDNNFGGSAFGGGSLPYRLAGAPFLLFRPFPWEVRSIPAAIAGIESFGLLLFVWRRREVVRSSLWNYRRNAFVLFLWIFTIEFLLIFAAAMTNFGLLVRQRIMLLPVALIIILSPPAAISEAVPEWITRRLRFASAERVPVHSHAIAQNLGPASQQLQFPTSQT